MSQGELPEGRWSIPSCISICLRLYMHATVAELCKCACSFEGVDLALFIAEDNDNILHYGPMAILGGTSVNIFKLSITHEPSVNNSIAWSGNIQNIPSFTVETIHQNVSAIATAYHHLFTGHRCQTLHYGYCTALTRT